MLLLAAPALSQTAPDLGTAGSYTVLGTNEIPTTGTVTCTRSSIDGDVGSTGEEITIVTFCDITGDTDAPVAAGVVSDFGNAYDAVEILNPLCDGPVPTATTTLSPGVYCSDAGTTIGADVTITLDGDADDIWVFRIGTSGLGALTGTGPNLAVVMGGTADACNVYWWTAEAATMTDAVFAGNVLSGAAATMTDTSWEGRALATTDVTLTDSNITGCPEPGTGTGTIIVEKRTNPQGSDQSFTFTGDAVGSLIDGEQIVVGNLAPGDYSSTEEPIPDGWELTDIVCNDEDSTGDLVTATANFVLDAGETVTCVFINTQEGASDGTITILKQASPSDTGQSFDFTGDLGEFSLMHGEFIVETLEPGTYEVSETVPAGWQLDSAVCSDGSPVDAIDLEAGENVTCTFTNIQDASLTIEKACVGSAMGNFGFTATGDGLENFDLDCGEDITFDGLEPGDGRSVEETTVAAGFDLTDASCDDGSLVTDIDLEAGEAVTCTFTNTARGSLTVVKTCTGFDEGNFEFSTEGDGLSDFDLDCGDDITFGDLVPGDGRSVEEIVPEGFLLTASCDDGSPTSNINIEPGEDVTCTFNNTLRPVIEFIPVPTMSRLGAATLVLLLLGLAGMTLHRSRIRRLS